MKTILTHMFYTAIVGTILVFSIQADLLGQDPGSRLSPDGDFILPPAPSDEFIPPPPPPTPPVTPSREELDMALQLALEREAAKTRPPTSAPNPSSRPRYRTSMFKRIIDVSSVIHDSYIPAEKSGEFLRKKILRRPGDRPYVLIESTVQRDSNTGEEFILFESAMVASEVLVRIQSGVIFEAFKNHVEAQGGVIVKPVGSFGCYLVSFEYTGPDTVLNAQRKLNKKTEVVAHVEPNYVGMVNNTPNDARFWQQWGMNQSNDIDINAVEGWDIVTDAINMSNNEDIIVAVIDTGARLTHEDLAPNLWKNLPEYYGTSGVDDDGNTFIDDIHGYDLYNDDSVPEDDDGHGTHVAGIIGARGHNMDGVAGVAWKVKLMICRVTDDFGDFETDNLIEGIEYARSNSAHIINGSLGVFMPSANLFTAVANARNAGILIVAAAGNLGDDNDTSMFPPLPASYPIDNVISIAWVDQNGNRASLSNYGSTKVDIAAPGSNIVSAGKNTNDDYTNIFQGTSQSAPHVSGAAALLKAIFPFDDYKDTKNRIMWRAKPLASWSGLTVTDGMLDLDAALYIWSNAIDLGGGWKNLDWFGDFSDSSYPWIWHAEHGWWSSNDASTASFTFWDLVMGWLGTSEDLYPNVFRYSDGVWLKYQIGTADPRKFENLTTGQTESIPRSQ